MLNMKAKEIFNRNACCVLGLPFDVVTISGATDAVNIAIDQQQRCFLTTPNLNFVIQAQSDDAFFDSVVESDLSVADGMPLIWVAKILGVPLVERVAGSTLFDQLSKQQNSSEKIKVFFFGGQEGVAEIAHRQLNASSPAMVSCGFYDPGFVSVDEMSSGNIIALINEANPDFLVVALGAKKGQQWIQHNRGRLNVPVISHLGAVINFVAGSVERAPILWQRFGLEWLWRIRQEPSLWRRYLFDGMAFLKLLVIKVFPLAIYDRYLRRSACFKSPCSIDIQQQDNVIIVLTGSIHYQLMTEVKQTFDTLIEQNKGDVTIDCAEIDYVDSAFIATLLLLQRYLNEQGRSLVLSSVSKRMINILSLNCVLNRFTLISA